MQPPLVAQVLRNEGRIETLTLKADEPRGSQPCPAVIRFRANLAMAGGGQVRYRWRSSDGRTTPFASLRLNPQEPRELFHVERIGKRSDKSLNGWIELEVEDAGGSKSARANFNVKCEDERGSLGITSNVLQVLNAREDESLEENLLERFEEQYLKRRGYSLDDVFNNKRRDAYERLRTMRDLQRKDHQPVGWSDGPAGVGAPGTVDANNCAWSSIGPTNINGRITNIAIDPTNNQRLFVTTVGGIWRSTDGARRWQRVSDDFLATVFASVAINPSTPSEVFIGGGDPNYHGGWGSGLGIWRSTSNGDPASWSKVSPAELDNHVIYRLRIDPTAPNQVYAATSNGVYLGTRSGSSITFARLAGFDAWTNDIAVDFSVTPRLVYAGVRAASATFARGIWKYNGTTWNQRNTGIPTANSRSILLALAQSSPSTLYAKVESDNGQSQGVYKTTSAAETPGGGGNAWTATSSALNDSCAGTFCYSWYNNVLEVDPANANIVWGGGLSIYRTTNGGTNWNNVGGGADGAFPLGVHADHHAAAFDPTNSKIVYVGNDGGIYRSSDTSLATWRWNNVSHNMVVTEYYRHTSQQALAAIAAGGTQDNGTVITFGNRTWYQPGGCDGFDVALDAANASTLYANCNGGLYELVNPVPGTVGGGSTATWSLPSGAVVKSPLVSDSVVAGAALAGGLVSGTTWRLLKTTDGLNWNYASPALPAGASITAIGIGPSSSFQTYYIGAGSGTIWRTTNGGGAWTQTSTGLPAFASANMITVDTTNPARAIAATSSGIFLTTDTGANWTTLQGTGSGALPTSAILGAVFDPSNANVVFAVSDIGAFRGTITPGPPATGTWTPFDEGLPDGLDINDIWVNRANGILKIGTMGHGAYQRDVRPGITCPAARLLVRDNVNDYGITPSASGVPDPEHPIPDPARPGFYKPDDTGAGRLYWWSSTDVRIDVPSTAPVKNQIANADHVEMQTCPINLLDCPPGSIRDANPQRGQTAKVYAQVTNTGLQPGSNVRVTALFADASAGLPLLPADFWTTTFPAGSTTCGALDTTSGWRFAEPANPCRVIPVVNPDVPEVVSYNWSVPMTAATHSCMLIITESASDPLDPSIRSTNERELWDLVPNHRQISLRNLHVVDASPAPMSGGIPRGFESMNVSNLSQSLGAVELVFSSIDFPANAVLGVFLPTTGDVKVRGVRATTLKLADVQIDQARGLNLNFGRFYRIEDPREAVLELPIPPGQTWKIGVAYDAGEMEEGRTARWSVLARKGGQVLGGNTYYIRPDPSLPANPFGSDGGGNQGGNSTSSSGFFSLGARAGVAVPHSPFNSVFDPHIAATVDLEYHFTNQFSVAGMFGYRRFDGPFSSHLNIYQFAGGPKFYLTSGTVRPFVNGGIGSFTFNSGTTKFGVQGGAGLQFRVWPRVWLEGEYVFHNVFTPGSNVKFSTVQGGVRFRF